MCMLWDLFQTITRFKMKEATVYLKRVYFPSICIYLTIIIVLTDTVTCNGTHNYDNLHSLTIIKSHHVYRYIYPKIYFIIHDKIYAHYLELWGCRKFFLVLYYYHVTDDEIATSKEVFIQNNKCPNPRVLLITKTRLDSTFPLHLAWLYILSCKQQIRRGSNSYLLSFI